VKLWKNRQRGLVRERIEAENADHMASMEELGLQTSRYIQRIEELEQVLTERGERSTRHYRLSTGGSSGLDFFGTTAGRSRGASSEQLQQATTSHRSSRRVSASSVGVVRFEDEEACQEEEEECY